MQFAARCSLFLLALSSLVGCREHPDPALCTKACENLYTIVEAVELASVDGLDDGQRAALVERLAGSTAPLRERCVAECVESGNVPLASCLAGASDIDRLRVCEEPAPE